MFDWYALAVCRLALESFGIPKGFSISLSQSGPLNESSNGPHFSPVHVNDCSDLTAGCIANAAGYGVADDKYLHNVNVPQ